MLKRTNIYNRVGMLLVIVAGLGVVYVFVCAFVPLYTISLAAFGQCLWSYYSVNKPDRLTKDKQTQILKDSLAGEKHTNKCLRALIWEQIGVEV